MVGMTQSQAMVRQRSHQVTVYVAATPFGNVATFKRNRRPVYQIKVDEVLREDGRVARVRVQDLELSASELVQQIKARLPLKCKVRSHYRARLLRRTSPLPPLLA